MPAYLEFDLDLFSLVSDAARAAGISEAELTHGVLRQRSYVFKQKTPVITLGLLRGFFAAQDPQRLADALVDFSFLRRHEDGSFRCPYGERLQRLREARIKGANVTNGERTDQRQTSDAGPHGDPPAGAALERRTSDAGATLERRKQGALLPSTENQSPSTDDRISSGRKKTRPAKSKDESGRFREVQAELEAAYLRVMGRAYVLQEKDWKAIQALSAFSLPTKEIGTRFEAALKQPYQAANGIADFNSRFNAFGRQPAPRDVRKAPQPAESVPKFTKSGDATHEL